jgi:hypothetical protein
MNTDLLMKNLLLNTKLYLMKQDFVQISKLREGTYWRRKTDGMIVLVSQKPDGSISIAVDATKTKGKTAETKAARKMGKSIIPNLEMLRR